MWTNIYISFLYIKINSKIFYPRDFFIALQKLIELSALWAYVWLSAYYARAMHLFLHHPILANALWITSAVRRVSVLTMFARTSDNAQPHLRALNLFQDAHVFSGYSYPENKVSQNLIAKYASPGFEKPRSLVRRNQRHTPCFKILLTNDTACDTHLQNLIPTSMAWTSLFYFCLVYSHDFIFYQAWKPVPSSLRH